MLTDDGIRLVKLFIDIDKKEQLRRFRERALVPYKRWKVTEADLRAHRLWNQYEKARHEMIARTSTRFAPWLVVVGDNKQAARIEVLRVVAAALGKGLDLRPPELAKPLRVELERLLGGKLD